MHERNTVHHRGVTSLLPAQYLVSFVCSFVIFSGSVYVSLVVLRSFDSIYIMFAPRFENAAL